MDLGIGALPWTTVDLFRTLGGEVVGVDNDPERVACAQPFAVPGLRFVEGSFDLGGEGPVHVLRAMNLLRQYPDEVQEEVLQTLRAQLAPGGWLVEGSSSKHGEVWTARVFHAGEERLVFGLSDHEAGFAPQRLWPYLPRSLAVRRRPGPLLADFARAWEAACEGADAADRWEQSVAAAGVDWTLASGPIPGTAEYRCARRQLRARGNLGGG